jgi:hypothetical protein
MTLHDLAGTTVNCFRNAFNSRLSRALNVLLLWIPIQLLCSSQYEQNCGCASAEVDPVHVQDQMTWLQRMNATYFGYGSDEALPEHTYVPYLSYLYTYTGFKVTAPGHAAMKCPGLAAFKVPHLCNHEVTGRGPNMWEPQHRIYTVWRLKEDRLNRTFEHTCVDAEFPHFPYAHYVEFSTLRPMHSVPGSLYSHAQAKANAP